MYYMKKQALGRGLSALIETEPVAAVGSTLFNEIEISKIHPNPNQPRTEFDDEALEELAASIRANGIISPITLRKISEDNYQIIAGERRYRASKLAGLDKIPAYIRDVDDGQVMEMALIENIQREDLNAIEIALSYNSLVATLNITQEALAERVGKKRATITNYLRLLKLPAEIQMGLKDKKIDMGHARALVSVENPEVMLNIYAQVLAEGASVRRTEELVRLAAIGDNDKKKEKKEKLHTFMPEEYDTLCKELNDKFNAKVKLSYNEKGKGKVVIPFDSDDDLMRLMSLFDKI
ncbi:MAG: ParB/RepB/Spo0J family partition protein [Paludibacteraceae bacterium]|nr:ParB/RepB/Spo0J family partition protein [Paludibacteraceae bacterium]